MDRRRLQKTATDRNRPQEHASKPPLDPFQALLARRLKALEEEEGARITAREAAARCRLPLSVWHYHASRRHTGRHSIPLDKRHAIAQGLGIPQADLDRAALLAAEGVIDVADYGISQVIAIWDPPDLSPEEKDQEMRKALEVIRTRLRG